MEVEEGEASRTLALAVAYLDDQGEGVYNLRRGAVVGRGHWDYHIPEVVADFGSHPAELVGDRS